MNIEKCTQDLSIYGYSLDNIQIITKQGKPTGIYISQKRGRLQCRTANDDLLWSGANLGDFVKAYWYAEPV